MCTFDQIFCIVLRVRPEFAAIKDTEESSAQLSRAVHASQLVPHRRVAEFTVYYLLPGNPHVEPLVERVLGIPRGTHTVVEGVSLPGVTKMVVPCVIGGGGGIGGVFGRVSLFVVEQLSGIEGSPRQWLHLNGEHGRQTEGTERGGS